MKKNKIIVLILILLVTIPLQNTDAKKLYFYHQHVDQKLALILSQLFIQNSITFSSTPLVDFNSWYETKNTDTEDTDKQQQMFKSLKDSQQVVLVTNDDLKSSKATLTLYEKENESWHRISSEMIAYIGENGFKRTKNTSLDEEDKEFYKYEGDKCSPMGIFSIDRIFGWAPDCGFSLPYMLINQDDYWVSGNSKEIYNVHMYKKGGPDKNWGVYEKLKIPQYKYAAVINYNMGPDRIIGNGSAIFLHIADKRGYTSGCTAVSENDLLKVLKWLKPEKKPVIIQGTLTELIQMGILNQIN